MGGSLAEGYKDFKSKRAAQVEKWAREGGKTGPVSDPSSWAFFSQGKLQDWISLENLLKTIDLAKQYNIDPTLLAAIFMNESALGTRNQPMFQNPGHVSPDAHGVRLMSLKKTLDKENPQAEYAAKFLSELLEKRSGDTEQALRDYVGRGKTIAYANQAKKWYGVPTSKLRKVDIGGKYSNRIQDIYSELMSMPEMEGLLWNTEKEKVPTVSIWDKLGIGKVIPFLSELLGIK